MFFSYLVRVSAQSVQTPKEGREVFCDTVITEFTPQQIIDYKNADISYINSNNLDAIIIGDPTKKYNCHFYAWYLSEDTNSYHRFTMPATEIYKYLEQQRNGDGSYLPSSDTLLADKIIKGNIDDLNNGTHHSMTWDPDPNSNRDWVSKSDERSLVKHAKRDSPYNEGGNYLLYHHYARTTNIDWDNPTINGPELICSRNSTTFYVDINPHYYMGIPDITDLSKFDSFSYDQEKKTITIDPKSDSYGNYTISVKIKNGAGIEKLIEKHFSLGSDPHIPYNTLQGPFCMCAWESYYIYYKYGGVQFFMAVYVWQYSGYV